MLKQSSKLFFDLLQPLSSSFVECRFPLVVAAACPINTIGSLKFGDFAPKLSETLDDGQLLHSDPSYAWRRPTMFGARQWGVSAACGVLYRVVVVLILTVSLVVVILFVLFVFFLICLLSNEDIGS
jgi:hypothetical protein